MYINKITECIVCGNKNLKEFIDLGEQTIQGSFITKNNPNVPKRKIHSKFLRCDSQSNMFACGLVQSNVAISPKILYNNYFYRSNISKTMRDHLKDITDKAISFFVDAGKQLNVLDIACNDLTLLRNYPIYFSRFGIDPSDITKEFINNNERISVINEVFPSTTLNTLTSPAFAGMRADVINTWYPRNALSNAS